MAGWLIKDEANVSETMTTRSGGDMIMRLYNEADELISFDDNSAVGDGGQLTFTAFGNQTFYFEADAPGLGTGGAGVGG